MKLFRTRFQVRALIGWVGLCALLFWALRVSRDNQPSRLYAGWLSHEDVSRRLQAARELGALGTETEVVVPALMNALLTDRDASVRQGSAVSLARVISRRNDGSMTAAAARAFVTGLDDTDPAVRAAAADGLGRIGPVPEEAIPGLLRGLEDESEWVRGAVVAALGLIQKKAGDDRVEVRRAIATAMYDKSLHVRESGMYAFWATAEKSPEFSIALLKDQDVRNRRSAVAALARSSPLASVVVPELTAALGDDDATVRNGAARALANLGVSTWAALPSD